MRPPHESCRRLDQRVGANCCSHGCRYTVRADGFVVHRPHASTKAKAFFVEELLAERQREQSSDMALQTTKAPDSHPQGPDVSRSGASGSSAAAGTLSRGSSGTSSPPTDMGTATRLSGKETVAPHDVRLEQGMGSSASIPAQQGEAQLEAEGPAEPIGEAEWNAAIDAANAPQAAPGSFTAAKQKLVQEPHPLNAVGEAEWTAANDAASALRSDPSMVSVRRALRHAQQPQWGEALTAAAAACPEPCHAQPRALHSGVRAPRLHNVTNEFYATVSDEAQRGSYKVLVTGSFARCLRQMPWWQTLSARCVLHYGRCALMAM